MRQRVKDAVCDAIKDARQVGRWGITLPLMQVVHPLGHEAAVSAELLSVLLTQLRQSPAQLLLLLLPEQLALAVALSTAGADALPIALS